jgi:hypothetical protein
MGTLKITSGNTKKLTITPGKPVLTVTGSPFDFLYKDGTEYSILTGEWSATNTDNATFTKETDHISMKIQKYASGSETAKVYTEKTISFLEDQNLLNAYTKIYIDWEMEVTSATNAMFDIRLALSESQEESNPLIFNKISGTTTSDSFSRTTSFIDISEIDPGEKYIQLQLYGSTANNFEIELRIYRIYLEKNSDYTPESFTLSFYSNGGSLLSPILKEAGKFITEPSSPTKDGCMFDGWYLDEELTIPVIWPFKILEDTSMYAAWIVFYFYSENINWNTGWKTPDNADEAIMIKDENSIQLKIGTIPHDGYTTVITAVTSALIDFKDINELIIDWGRESLEPITGAAHKSSFIISTNKMGSRSEFLALYEESSKSFDRKEGILDTSNITGEAYIRIHSEISDGSAMIGEDFDSTLTIYEIRGK